MGSAVSASAADERKAQQRLQWKQKREKKRQKLLQKQTRQIQDLENPSFLDKNGKPYYFDKKGRAFYINDTGDRYYLDDHGIAYYLDDNDKPYYLDENREKFYLDKNREPYYLSKKGKRYCLDTEGRKYYFNEAGETYLAVLDSDDDTEDEDDISNMFKEKRMGVFSPSSSNRDASSKFNEKEMQIRSPVTPFRERTNDSQNTLHVIDHREALPVEETETHKHSSMTPVTAEASETQMHIQVFNQNKQSDKISNLTPGMDDESEQPSDLTESEYPNILAVTPDYVKDETKESETSRNAQIEAEDKILKKLLESEKARGPIPAPKSFRKVGAFNIKLKNDTQDCSIVGQGFLPNGDLILADLSNRKLKLFDPGLQFITSYTVDYIPQGLCTGNKDSLVHVTFKTTVSSGMSVVKADEKSIISQHTVRIKGVPFGIARSNVAIAMIVSAPEGWQIHLRDLNGKLFKNIKLENMQSIFSLPDYIAITRNIKLLVSDRGTNTVYELDLKGEEILQYKQLREPRGMCVDDKGSIYITSPGVVHQITESGERIKALMRRETTGFAPCGVCYDSEDGLLMLTGKSNNVVAYELTE